MQQLDPYTFRREGVLGAALLDGRIADASLPTWRAAYDADPGGTVATLAQLQPVLLDFAARSTPDLTAALDAGRSLFPELNRGRRGGRLARGSAGKRASAAAVPAGTDPPPPAAPSPEDGPSVDPALTTSLFPETRERQRGRITRAD